MTFCSWWLGVGGPTRWDTWSGEALKELVWTWKCSSHRAWRREIISSWSPSAHRAEAGGAGDLGRLVLQAGRKQGFGRSGCVLLGRPVVLSSADTQLLFLSDVPLPFTCLGQEKHKGVGATCGLLEYASQSHSGIRTRMLRQPGRAHLPTGDSPTRPFLG